MFKSLLIGLALTVCVFVLLASDAAAGGGGFLGLRGRRALRRADVVVVQPVAVVQSAVVVQRVRQVVVAQPIVESVYSQVQVAPVYAHPVMVQPVYAQQVQQQVVQPVQPVAQAASLDLQLGDLANLLRKLNCVAGCFATP